MYKKSDVEEEMVDSTTNSTIISIPFIMNSGIMLFIDLFTISSHNVPRQ